MIIKKTTTIGELLEKHPELKDYLISLNDEYSNLNNPELFKMMKDIATMEMVAIKGGFEFEELKEKLEFFLNK